MTTMTFEERLVDNRARIERLNALARGATAEAQAQIQRHLDAIGHEEESARTAARERPAEAEDAFGQLRMRIDVAEQSAAADLSGDWDQFGAAVLAELRRWDTYIERLQTRAAAKAGSERPEAEAAISELRRLRITVAERLAELADAPADGWREQSEPVTAARRELELKADELAMKLR